MTRLKALWTVLTAREFVLCNRVGEAFNPKGEASTFGILLVSLCRAYNEAPEHAKPGLKQFGSVVFMPIKEANNAATEMLNDLLSNVAKESSLKESVAKPPRKRKK